MDIKEFDMLLDTLEQFTVVLKKETDLVRKRDLVNHQEVIDQKALLMARLNDFDQKYGQADYANRLYEIMIESINQAVYEAEAKPIGYSQDHGTFRSGKDVYNHVGSSAIKFSGQF